MKQGLMMAIIIMTMTGSFLGYDRLSDENIEKKVVAIDSREVRASKEIVGLEPIRVEVYEGMTLEELGAKLEKSLNSTLSGYGNTFAKYAIEYNVDPYLALAIVLHETGCKWNCSALVRTCNNIGGQKGTPGCNGGSYRSFPTLDDGIRGFFSNLSKNYYAYGLTTPEAMNPKYAASTTWATKVNSYIYQIRTK